jgi:hypothetical protein
MMNSEYWVEELCEAYDRAFEINRCYDLQQNFDNEQAWF